MRSMITGVIFVLLTLASTFGGMYLRTLESAPAHEGKAEVKKVFKKLKPVSVPVIRDGELKGYVSAEFSYALAAKEGHGEEIDPESYILDEAFRQIYANNDLDFTHIEKIDIVALTKSLTDRVNERLGHPLVQEITVRNLSLVSRDELPH